MQPATRLGRVGLQALQHIGKPDAHEASKSLIFAAFHQQFGHVGDRRLDGCERHDGDWIAISDFWSKRWRRGQNALERARVAELLCGLVETHQFGFEVGLAGVGHPLLPRGIELDQGLLFCGRIEAAGGPRAIEGRLRGCECQAS